MLCKGNWTSCFFPSGSLEVTLRESPLLPSSPFSPHLSPSRSSFWLLAGPEHGYSAACPPPGTHAWVSLQDGLPARPVLGGEPMEKSHVTPPAPVASHFSNSKYCPLPSVYLEVKENGYWQYNLMERKSRFEPDHSASQSHLCHLSAEV